MAKPLTAQQKAAKAERERQRRLATHKQSMVHGAQKRAQLKHFFANANAQGAAKKKATHLNSQAHQRAAVKNYLTSLSNAKKRALAKHRTALAHAAARARKKR